MKRRAAARGSSIVTTPAACARRKYDSTALMPRRGGLSSLVGSNGTTSDRCDFACM
jgi:hypothetical protein